MTGNNDRKKAAVCALALACVALMVATSMICLVGNDGNSKVTELERDTGTTAQVGDTVSVDSPVSQYVPVIGQENASDADVIGEKDDEPQANGGKTFWNGLIKYEVKTDSTCKVVDYNGSDRHPIVPDIACMEGHKYIVDEIGERGLFQGDFGRHLYSVEIGPYIKTISDNAMWKQGDEDNGFTFKIRDLEHSQLSYIGKLAFSEAHMTCIELPASLTLIDDNAFRNCDKLGSVVLHSKSLQIKSEVFRCCFSLRDINLENVSRIGSYAFCDTMVADANLSSAWDIREGAFLACKLKHITFAKNIAILEDEAFPGMCFSDFNNNILPKTPGGLAGKEFRKDIDNWYHQIR